MYVARREWREMDGGEENERRGMTAEVGTGIYIYRRDIETGPCN
jgi:hypothetical protein